jgi:hypothetical protein
MRNRYLVDDEQAQAQVGVARWCTRGIHPPSTKRFEKRGQEFIGYRGTVVANR